MPPAPTVTPAGPESSRPRLDQEAVARVVLATLGRPPNLFRVDVVPLWGGRYRVNVITGTDPSAVRIPHSYFVEAAADGAITGATPPIVRRYP